LVGVEVGDGDGVGFLEDLVFGWRWWWRFSYPYYWEVFPEVEKSILRTEAALLKESLQAIERRLSQLEKAQA